MWLNSASVGWAVSADPAPYLSAVDAMETRVAAIADRSATELIWCLEHHALYTAGRSACAADLVDDRGLPVYVSGRGGKHTWHGPGQRIVYVMLDLRRRGRDVRGFVTALEDWIIAALAELGVTARADRDRVGLWVPRPGGTGADKIAAIGLRIRKWISLHGISINLDPDLSHYDGIVPCGIDDPDHGVTSVAALGVSADMAALDAALKTLFSERFGPVHIETAPWP